MLKQDKIPTIIALIIANIMVIIMADTHIIEPLTNMGHTGWVALARIACEIIGTLLLASADIYAVRVILDENEDD